MKLIKIAGVVALTAFAGFASNANAALITSAPIGGPVIDFSQFNSGLAAAGFTPFQVGGLVGEDVIWTSNVSNAAIGSGHYGLGSNGLWNADRNGFVGVNSSGGSMSFTFADAVSAVGGFVNYAPGYGTPVISVYGAGDVLLETYNLLSNAPINTGGQTNAGAFRGIDLGSAVIYRFELTGSYAVLGELNFTRAPASVPDVSGVMGLLACAFASLVAVRRRRAGS